MADSFDAVFHGNSESECIDFVCAVRQHAKDNGKARDNAWIADEVFNAFRGKALKWYARLPVNIRGDWELLQQALLGRWTTDDDEDDVSTRIETLAIVPTPAAAAPATPPLYSTSSRSPPQNPWEGRVGRIRIRATGVAGVRYLSKDFLMSNEDWLGSFRTTTDATLALKIRLIITALNFCRLELVEHESGLSVLAAFSYGSSDWDATNCWGLLVGVDAPGLYPLKDRRSAFSGYDRWKERTSWTDKWQIGNTGVLKLCGPGDTTKTARFLKASGLSARKYHLTHCICSRTSSSTLWTIDPSESSTSLVSLFATLQLMSIKRQRPYISVCALFRRACGRNGSEELKGYQRAYPIGKPHDRRNPLEPLAIGGRRGGVRPRVSERPPRNGTPGRVADNEDDDIFAVTSPRLKGVSKLAATY